MFERDQPGSTLAFRDKKVLTHSLKKETTALEVGVGEDVPVARLVCLWPELGTNDSLAKLTRVGSAMSAIIAALEQIEGPALYAHAAVVQIGLAIEEISRSLSESVEIAMSTAVSAGLLRGKLLSSYICNVTIELWQ